MIFLTFICFHEDLDLNQTRSSVKLVNEGA